MNKCKNCGLYKCPPRCIEAKSRTQKFIEMRKRQAKNYTEKKNDNYKRACEFRELESNKKRQEDMWNEFLNQFEDFNIDADSVELFLDDMMEQYRINLIKILSGIGDDVPSWQKVEVEDEK